MQNTAQEVADEIEIASRQTLTSMDINRADSNDFFCDPDCGEQKFHAAFDNLGDAIFIIDMAGCCLAANKESCKRYGYAQDELVGKSIRQIEMPSETPEVLQQLALFTHKGHAVFETTHLARNGAKIPTEISARQFDNDGQTLAIYSCRDIAGRKRLYSKLRSAKELAEAANKAKSDFLTVISHEIRTPMNGILGMGQLLKNTELNGGQREYLDAIMVSADNLLHIINDLLDFSRIESGQVKLERSRFSLREAVDKTLKPLRIEIELKGLELKITVGDDVPDALCGDPLRVEQIIINLVANAIKFTHKGEIRVEIALEASAGKQCLLHFKVADSGIGIARGISRRIFKPFVQADSSTTRKYGGTGLGLTITKQLVELMKGKIWLESQPGSGSTFHFTVPFDQAAPAPVKKEKSAASNQKGLLSWEGRSLHILLAEDHDINRKLSVAILKRLGHTVSEAENGKMALETAELEQPDIILMDIEMPEMDGRESTRQIREREKISARHVPIIALTAHAVIGSREGFLASGFDGYVSKPIDFKELSKEMQRVVALHPTATPLRPRPQPHHAP